jgi:hypothetical protein
LHSLVLNELNLTNRRLTSFMASLDFILIVLVPWSKFLLCHTPIRSFSALQDQISILIMGCMTTWSRGSHKLVSKLGYEIWSYPFISCIFVFVFCVNFSLFRAWFCFKSVLVRLSSLYVILDWLRWIESFGFFF